MQEDNDKVKDKDLYNEELYNDGEENEEESEEDAEDSATQNSGNFGSGGKTSLLKGVSNFAGKAGKTIKKVATVIAKLPMPVKIALITVLAGIITFLVMELLKNESTKQVRASVTSTVSQMKKKMESEDLTEEQKQMTQKAINYFEENNSYLYFTIEDINNAYKNFVNEYRGSTNDVGSRNYQSLSTIYGEDELIEIKEDGTEDNSLLNNRIAYPSDKQSLYQHLLMTEKYNFNAVQWNWYGHGHNGEELSLLNGSLKYNDQLGLLYPNDGMTDLDAFITTLSPYMQTWHLPLAFHSAFLTKSGSSKAASTFTYSMIKNTYSDIIVNRYDMQSCLLNTQFMDYIESTYKSKVAVDVKVTIEYRAQSADDSPSRSIRELSSGGYEPHVAESIQRKSGVYTTHVVDNTYYGQVNSNATGDAVKISTSIGEYIRSLNRDYVEKFIQEEPGVFHPISTPAYVVWKGTPEATLSGITQGGTYYSVEYKYTERDGIYTIQMYRHELLLILHPKKVFVKDANGNIIYDRYYKYEYTGTSVLEADKIAEYYVNTRAKDPDMEKQDILGKALTKDPIPEIDPTKEVEEGKSITWIPEYHIKTAKTFDLAFANEYNYIKYNDEDVDKRINWKYEKEVKREDYYNMIDGKNEITTGNIAHYINGSVTLGQIVSEKGLEVVSNGFKNGFSAAYNALENVLPKTFVHAGTTTIVPGLASGEVGATGNLFYQTATLTDKDIDTNPYNVHTFSDIRTIELTYQNIYRNSQSYIEQIGIVDGENKRGIHHMERFWEDKITQVYAKEELYTTNDLIDYNASYNYKIRENDETTESDEKKKYKELTEECESSYEKYEMLEKNEELNNIDFMNSNSNMFNEYLIDTPAESKITGYNRAWLEFALQEAKKLFKEIEDEKGRCAV